MKPNNHNHIDERWARDCAEITMGLIVTVLLSLLLAHLANRYTGSDDAELDAQYERFNWELADHGNPP